MSAAALAPEEQARGNFYGLLARLFYAPPERALLEALAASAELAGEGPGAPLAQAWRELVRAAAKADPEAVREEYEAVFVGIGKAEVTLYVGAYLEHAAIRNPLVEVREFIARHALARKESAQEPEDHVAALCDAMRHLIGKDDAAAQRELLERFLAPAADGLCDAIIQCEQVNFYRPVARFAKIFFALDRSALDLE